MTTSLPLAALRFPWLAPLGRSTLGSYSTDGVGIRFDGKALLKLGEADWILAGNGKPFLGVKFLPTVGPVTRVLDFSK